jgi:uroporphyrinogen III methyltransferase/synthase
MGARNLEHITFQLTTCGRAPETPVAVIRWGTTPEQETVTGTLATIAEVAAAADISPPAIIVVGEVAALRQELNWFEGRPLFGKTILVTRAREQASAFRALLEERGARCLEFPTIEVAAPPTWEPLDRALKSIDRYQWVIFTSVNGVRFLFQRLEALGEDVRALRGIRLAAIGPKTAAALEERGLRLDLVPSEYRAEAVIDALGEAEIRGRRFLLPRAAKARELLPEKLVEMGGEVDVVTAYETVRPSEKAEEVRRLLREGAIHCITFTSSSTVENFIAMVGDDHLPSLLAKAVVACIGPITAETARKHDLTVEIIPDEYTIEALTAALVAHFQKV